MGRKQYLAYYQAQAALEARQKPILDIYSEDESTWHLIYGLRCGYPLCCVLWFCSIHEFWSTGNFASDYNKPMGERYSLCPNCTLRALQEWLN